VILPEGFRCGFIAVVGRPNVGKSTLINSILGRKVSIVTPKPQTTRHRILGVHSETCCQMIFVDTPGMHQNAGKAMNRMMNRTAANAVVDADLVLFMCEADRWTDEDEAVLRHILAAARPSIAVLNKIDRVRQKQDLLRVMADMAGRYNFKELLPMSARSGENIDRLLGLVPPFLPVSPPLYPEDMVSDRSDAFRAAELIREKLTILLRQELPYGLTVQIERYEQEPEGLSLNAVIWVERDSQKGMVVGKGGSLLKKVGSQSRLELKKQLGIPVHVELWVKVKDNWADSDKDLAQLGYDLP
jgi:GTP-binding protein Era